MMFDEDQLKAWMLAGLDGDASAHLAMLGALVGPLREFYQRRLGGSDERIEALVQESLVAIHERRSTFERDGSLLQWVSAIADFKLSGHLVGTAALPKSLTPAEHQRLAFAAHEGVGRGTDIFGIGGEAETATGPTLRLFRAALRSMRAKLSRLRP